MCGGWVSEISPVVCCGFQHELTSLLFVFIVIWLFIFSIKTKLIQTLC